MLILGEVKIVMVKITHSCWVTDQLLPVFVKMLPYSCGYQEEHWWEARSQEKHDEKDNCSSELTQDASLPFQ